MRLHRKGRSGSGSGPLRVLVNVLFQDDRSGGIGTYVHEIVRALGARRDVEQVVLGSLDLPLSMHEVAGLHEARVVTIPVHHEDRYRYASAHFLGAPAVAGAFGCDVVFCPANFGLLVAPGLPVVTTVHDLNWMKPGSTWGAKNQFEERGASRTALTIRRSTRLITISEFSASEIVRDLGVPAENVDVVHHGVPAIRRLDDVAAARCRVEMGVDHRPYVLCIAQKRPYKRQDVLIRALAAVGPGVDLVLPGASTDYEQELRALSRSLGIEDRVHLLPWLDDDQVAALYMGATAVMLPSELEGFGFPILEAMAHGVPVACSNRTAFPEVAGDAALIFDPAEQEQVEQAMRRLAADPVLRADLVARGQRRVAEFSWQRAAEGTLRAFHQARGDR